MLVTTHRINWDLSVLDAELSGEMAEAARLADATAVHLPGFTTQSLTGDVDRTPEEVAQVSARVLEAAVQAALIERTP